VPNSTTKDNESRCKRVNLSLKARAHTAVQRARNRGDLVNPGVCSECKSDIAVDGHHDDYKKPLDVRWLCMKCHRRWHKDNGPGLNHDKFLDEPRCPVCGGRFPAGSRIDRKFCSEKCRFQAFKNNRNMAKVARTTLLKSEKISVVLHMPKDTVGIHVGDWIRWQKVKD